MSNKRQSYRITTGKLNSFEWECSQKRVMKQLSKSSKLVILALILAGCSPAPKTSNAVARTKNPSQTSREIQEIRRKKFREREAERTRQLRPIVKNYFDGNYAAALSQFRMLEITSREQFSWQIAMCLWELGRPKDALIELAKAGGKHVDEERLLRLKAAMAISAGDPRSLDEAITRWIQRDRMAVTHSSAELIKAQSRAVYLDPRQRNIALIEMAREALNSYEKKALFTLLEYAVRNGDSNFEAQGVLARACHLYGEIRRSLSLYKKLSVSATGTLKAIAKSEVYDLTNVLSILGSESAIASEEQRRIRNSLKYQRAGWINDELDSQSANQVP